MTVILFILCAIIFSFGGYILGYVHGAVDTELYYTDLKKMDSALQETYKIINID